MKIGEDWREYILPERSLSVVMVTEQPPPMATRMRTVSVWARYDAKARFYHASLGRGSREWLHSAELVEEIMRRHRCDEQRALYEFTRYRETGALPFADFSR